MNLLNKSVHWFKKNPKRLIIVAAASAIILGGWSLFKPKDIDDGAILREYPVTRGNITVGVEASGKLTSKRTIHTFAEGLIFEEYLVPLGGEVKKGDALARISLTNLNEVIDRLEKEAADAKDAYLQAGNAITRFQLQSSLSAEEKQQNSKLKYEADLKQITEELDDLAKQLEALEKQKLTLSPNNKEALEEEKQTLEKSLKAARAELDALEEAREAELKREMEEAAYQSNINKEQLIAYQNAIEEAAAALKKAEAEAEEEAIKRAKAALEQAEAAKRLYLMQSNKGLSDRFEASRLAYEEKKKQAEQNISDLRAKIRNLANKSEEVLAKQSAELDTQIAEIKDKIEKANRRLEDLKKQRNEELEREAAAGDTQDKLNELELSSLRASEQRAYRTYDTAQQELEKAIKLLDEPILYAETDGIVLTAPYRSQEKITNEKAVVEIGSLKDMELELVIEPVDINDIEIGQFTSISVSVFPSDELEGEVISKNLAVNDGNYSIKVKLKENPLSLLEGMAANATIVTKQKKDVLILSNKAIKLVDGKQVVKVKDEKGHLQTIEITAGFSDGQVSEILSGLSENDVVIVED